MNFAQLIQSLSSDTTNSLGLFRPELALCATIVVMLLLRVFRGLEKIDAFWIALIGSGDRFVVFGALAAVGLDRGHSANELFTGMLVYDSFSDLLPHDFAAVCRAVCHFHEAFRHSRPGRCARFLHAGAGRDGRHVHNGHGQSLGDDFPRRRNGQRAVLRLGGHAQGTAAQQRSGAEVFGLWCRGSGHHAVWHQPAGRRAGNLSSADDGPAVGRSDRARPFGATKDWSWAWVD